MPHPIKRDVSCVPYQRKGLYLGLTVPLLLVMGAVAVLLGTYHLLLSLAYLLLYLSMSGFQAYCCAYQSCPYVGRFCPAVTGIVPASLLAKVLYDSKEMVRSEARFERHVAFAVVSWIGLILLPLFWLAQVSVGLAIGYVVIHLVYTLIFWLTICPACAIRDICPGGRLYRTLLRGGFSHTDRKT